MTLAMEIALKAWQCRERNEEPDKSHDLLKLFDGLEDKTQARLEARMPDVLDPYLGSRFLPVMPGLRKTLSSHSKAFERWRYVYEVRHANFETPDSKKRSQQLSRYMKKSHGNHPSILGIELKNTA